MSINHRLLIIKTMTPQYVEIALDGCSYRILMRYGKPRMIFDIYNKQFVMVPRGFDIISLLNYKVFKLVLEGLMEKPDEKYVYVVKTTPEDGKLNWHADCLDFVEYVYGYAIKYCKKTDQYYIVADEDLEITTVRNDDGIVATLHLDVDNNIQLDQD